MRAASRVGQQILRSQCSDICAASRSSTLLSRHPFLRPVSRQPLAHPFRRYNSSLTVPASSAGRQHASSPETSSSSPTSESGAPQPRLPEPSYQLTFTCKPCGYRSSHRVTKHGYHKGTTLITCPECKNRHIISDHLQIFMDKRSTLEDILQRKHGQLEGLLKKGRLGMRPGELVANEGEEDIEFWDDKSETQHERPENYYHTWRRRLWEQEKDFKQHGNIQNTLQQRAENVGTPEKGEDPPTEWKGDSRTIKLKHDGRGVFSPSTSYGDSRKGLD